MLPDTVAGGTELGVRVVTGRGATGTGGGTMTAALPEVGTTRALATRASSAPSSHRKNEHCCPRSLGQRQKGFL